MCRVKIKMLEKRVSVTKLAKVTGYSRTYLSSVINGHRGSERVRRVIALALGADYSELWGVGQPKDDKTSSIVFGKLMEE